MQTATNLERLEETRFGCASRTPTKSSIMNEEKEKVYGKKGQSRLNLMCGLRQGRHELPFPSGYIVSMHDMEWGWDRDRL